MMIVITNTSHSHYKPVSKHSEQSKAKN